MCAAVNGSVFIDDTSKEMACQPRSLVDKLLSSSTNRRSFSGKGKAKIPKRRLHKVQYVRQTHDFV